MTLQVRSLTPADPEWPDTLGEIGPHGPPGRLYVAGGPLPDGAHAVAVVGARRATVTGLEIAGELAGGLAEAGFTIVSGLARGIDAAAHRAALQAGGRTVAVLGCGMNVDYPRAHRDLKRRIAEQGAVVTEYAEGTEPAPYRFPERNRIIVGLSSAVVLVEGGDKSGALITARIGLDAGRHVFAVPGSVRNAMAAAPNELIRRSEAALVTDVGHICEELAPGLAWKRPVELGLGSAPPELDDPQRALLAVLDDVPAAPSALARASDLPHGRLALALSQLEVRGLATRRPGGYAITRTGATCRRTSEAVGE